MFQAPPEKPVDRLAIAFEQLDERVARALLELQYQLVVAIHK
jgi:hypothetical protein